MLWSRTRPPELFPNAVLTRYGWADPVTGELLVVLRTPSIGPGPDVQQTQNGTTRIHVTKLSWLSGLSSITVMPTMMRRKTLVGMTRITCPIPYNTGINPNW